MASGSGEPELVTVRPGQERDFLATVRRGFHGDLSADADQHDLDWFETDRMIGFRADDRWISTTGAFTRQLTVPGGGAVDVAAVTMVTVATDRRRQRLLSRMMAHQLADVARRREPVAILWAAEGPIYGRFGYGNATRRLQLSGRTREVVLRPEAPVAPGRVELLGRDGYLAEVVELHARLLRERPGALTRPPAWWRRELEDRPDDRGGASALRHLVHRDEDGVADGYASYRVRARWAEGDLPDSEVVIMELDGATEAVRIALWRYLLDIDLVRSFSMGDAAVDEPLLQLLTEQRSVRARVNDALHLRLVDVRAALAVRTYAAEVDLVIGVRDTLLPANDGAVRLRTDGDGRPEVSRARRRPDLSLDVRELGAVYLGGISLATLARAGLVTEHRDGAVRTASRAFGWDRAPFCPDHF